MSTTGFLKGVDSMVGTTPTHTFTLPFSTDIIDELKVTYKQNGSIILEKYKEHCCSIKENQVDIKLSQEETFLFDCDSIVEVQLRIKTIGGDVIRSNVHKVMGNKCLDREVL